MRTLHRGLEPYVELVGIALGRGQIESPISVEIGNAENIDNDRCLGRPQEQGSHFSSSVA
jgi:hypothetical protein